MRLGHILVCVVLISIIALSSCAQEEDPYGTMYDPLDALIEKLQLTDEQVEIVETETGTLQLTAEQVDIIRDPVEQLLSDLEPLLDKTRWQEIEDVFERLLTQGEADLEILTGIAEELQELELAGEVEVITKLEKVSGEVGSSGHIPPLATGSSVVTTVYTPWGTPQEIDEGDEHINFGWTCEEKIGLGEPIAGAEIKSEIGGLNTYSFSWIGSDRATALLGIEFEVPADDTDVSITTTMEYITATTSLVSGFAGTYIATRFADEPVHRYKAIDSPLGWDKILELFCLVFSPFVPGLTYVGAVTDAGAIVLDALNFVELAQALDQMEYTEEEEVVYSAGSLDKGHYRFYIGLHAQTSAAIIGLAHAAAYGQITHIKVTQDIPSFDLSITSTEGGQVTEPGEGISTCWAGAEIDLVAEAEEDYQFVNWSGDVDTIANVNAASTTITMDGDYAITANFEEEGEEPVYFPDANLEAAIREAIGKPTGDIYRPDLEGLTSLGATNRNISNLTGLEYCTQLTFLWLGMNQVSDISPLADLTSLTCLQLDSNQISNIAPLGNLTNLTQLHLGFNQISDISPLSNLADLGLLILWSNQIADISPLASLTNLTWLEVNNNQITDILPLANLTNLTRVNLHHNQITDISPLANLSGLGKLYLDSNQIGDISALANLAALTYVGLYFNQISDISPLVQNEGLSAGDAVALVGNPLSEDSIEIYIPQLEARGVTVYY